MSNTQPGEPRIPHRYQLLRVVGEGGMGTVYSAHDREMGRTVALKVVHPKLAKTPVARERFLREMRISAQVEHPNVIRLYDFGQLDEQLFFTMELLQGPSLGDELREHSVLSHERIVCLGSQLARGLHAAHSRKIIHRDLKPSNVILHKYDGGEVLKVVDFGIAKVLGSPLSTLTRKGVILCSPHYVSSELVLGNPPDARSDLYSLGVLLFELAAGRLPFQTQDPAELLRLHALEPAPPLRSVNPEVSIQLAQLIDELLHKDPARRPGTALEVDRRLTALQKPTADSVKTRTLRPTTVRRRSWLTLAAASLVALALAIGFLVRRHNKPPQQTTIQALPPRAATPVEPSSPPPPAEPSLPAPVHAAAPPSPVAAPTPVTVRPAPAATNTSKSRAESPPRDIWDQRH
jgi:eukaryotic-like serine/threonine-protein kinase